MSTALRVSTLLITFAVSLFPCGCATRHANALAPVPVAALPALGSRLPFSVDPQYLEMTAAGSLDPACRISVGNVVFTVAVSREGIVKYVATTDASFKTPEGVHVGAPVAQVRSAGASDPLPESGWGFYAQLPSGWYAGFVNGKSLSEPPLPSDATVTWLFRR